MSNWLFLEAARVTGPSKRVPDPSYCTTSEDGFNGMFRFGHNGDGLNGEVVRCIASDGGGWEHVSVTVEDSRRPPPWGVMCRVKDLFWADTEWVVQFHPPKSEHVNNHPGCMHLWRCTDAGKRQPTPPWQFVGVKKGRL